MTNPYAPPQAVVHDIVDPLAGAVLAERGTRFGAAFVDGLIFALMVYLPLIVTAIIANSSETDSRQMAETGAFGVGMVLALAGFAVWMGLTIKFMIANGQSIGKKGFGIKVVRKDGSRASVPRLIFLRNGLNIMLGLIPLYGLVDSLLIFGEQRRCVHDYLADTIVIKA